MIKKLTLICLMIFVTAEVSSNEIEQVRKLFFESTKSQSKTELMFEYLKNKNVSSNPVLKAYYGMTYMLMAKHGFNFFTRLSNFNKGKEILEQAIAQDKSNAELRFLRLSVQMNIPTFLNYSSNIDGDKKIISEKFTQISDEYLKSKILQFYSNKKMTLP
jgi:hypothetical protein